MNIIQANRSHRKAIIEILRAEKLPTDDLPGNIDHFFIATDNDEIVGAIGLEHYSNYGLLRSMVVREDFRHQNIAGSLINQLEKHAADLKIITIYLLTETASKYFAKKGYIEIQRDNVPDAVTQSTEFSSVCPVSATIMKKTL